jgi:hypothetical protein
MMIQGEITLVNAIFASCADGRREMGIMTRYLLPTFYLLMGRVEVRYFRGHKTSETVVTIR